MLNRLALVLLAASVALTAQETKDLAVLRYIDLHVGTGIAAAPGKRFTVHYTGWLKDGTKFDSSVDRNTPFQFVQGRRQVIPGWDAGFEGMKAGGKRKLIIPYQLAYGEQGSGPIPPKAELTFEVDLLDVTDAPTVAPAIDLILPYKDLETRALALEKTKRSGDSPVTVLLLRIGQINRVWLETARADAPSISKTTLDFSGEPQDLTESFSAVRKELDEARNGYLSGDAQLFGQNTTRRGLFTALLVQIAEVVARAEDLSRSH